MKSYLNQFTGECWQGNVDKTLALNYVARISFSFGSRPKYTGRIDGIATHDQKKLLELKNKIWKEVMEINTK